MPGRGRRGRGARPPQRAIRRRLDLVLLNTPPVRVHKLRFTEAPASAAAGSPALPDLQRSADPLMHIDSNGVAAAGIALGAAAL